jgi:rhodanese-related sulfurtransferase
MFGVSDQMTNEQYMHIREHITQTISDLKDVVARHPVQSLTGASGSFEILQTMTGRSTDNPGLDAIGTEELRHVFQNIFGKSTRELLSISGLPPERAPLAPTGLTLMTTVCDELNISLIQVSPFALKEGVIREMAEWDSLTVEEIIQRNKGTIVDVRSYLEYQGGHVAGSVLIPYPDLEKQLDRLKFLKPPLILVCRSGNRSRQAADKLKHLGINCMDGGSWTDINYLKSLHNSE